MEEIIDGAFVTVEKAGLFDTLQDRGRYGYRSQGVPVSGAMDDYSYTIGNLLLANNHNDVSLETTLFGPQLRFSHCTIIAITGANQSPKLNDKPIEMWQPIEVSSNDRISFNYAKSGYRSYLAIKGGFQIPHVLGSASTYTKGKFGGIEGRRLGKGDVICYKRHATSTRTRLHKSLFHAARLPIDDQEIVTLRVVEGPQNKMFSSQGLHCFFTETYQVTQELDRMGIRLYGKPIEFDSTNCDTGTKEVITDAVTYGAIQVPANGQPVILGADSQTTGGYTKMGCVISVDAHKVAQLRPLQRVRFIAVTIKEAQEKYRKLQRFYARLEKFIKK